MSALEAFMSLDTLNLIALLAVVFIGLPHGAMDGALAMHFGWTSRPALVSMFLIAYVGLAGAVVLAWAPSAYPRCHLTHLHRFPRHHSDHRGCGYHGCVVLPRWLGDRCCGLHR